ncbi:longitudinals lacking protein-like isoform X1 [Hylaeus anthracinus]|nr:longitudinals lacking protein-like isoform X1 [Hylaeus volcanicus]XP_054003788.1 longitudinals lacking protein-like isoform X1 [Hylaeus anthracinus]
MCFGLNLNEIWYTEFRATQQSRVLYSFWNSILPSSIDKSYKLKQRLLGHQVSIMADEQQQFFLKWNDFQSNMVSSFKHLRDEKSFTDVTLACDGQTCKAHKMVLSACSPYFKSLLEENPSKHPIIILKDVAYSHLQAILEFMYAGEVNVSQDQLPAFLKTADRLKVKGLAEAPGAIKREG